MKNSTDTETGALGHFLQIPNTSCRKQPEDTRVIFYNPPKNTTSLVEKNFQTHSKNITIL